MFAALLAGIVVSSCTDIQKSEINHVLDSRDRAISQRNIGDYSALIADSYHDHGKTKVEIVATMIHLLDEFEATEMHSFDRTIRLIDKKNAQCEQSYKLRVKADGTWREIIQREQLLLHKTSTGWKISGGL